MSKHTPAPWRVIKKEYPVGYSEYEIAWSEDGELVCDVVYTEADARLIAAAPDLLEALQAVQIDAVGIGSGENAISDKTREMVNAAIAKAEGKA